MLGARYAARFGTLLLAADVYYKSCENADLYRDVFINQWAFALGTQLTRGKMKYRLRYSFNTSPVNHSVGDSLNGHPVAQEAIYFLQATSLAAINQHRISGGFGREDFLLPGLGCRVVHRPGTHVAIWGFGGR